MGGRSLGARPSGVLLGTASLGTLWWRLSTCTGPLGALTRNIGCGLPRPLSVGRRPYGEVTGSLHRVRLMRRFRVNYSDRIVSVSGLRWPIALLLSLL